MSSEPSTVGIHRLSPAEGVALTNAGDVARMFLPGLRLAESRLLPSSNLDQAIFEWEVPGTRFPRSFDHESHRRAWLDTVPLTMGELDAALHTSLIGGHTTGPLVLTHPTTGLPAVFPAYEPPSVDEHGVSIDAPVGRIKTPPLTLGVATAGPDGIVVTDKGVWHTRVPEYPPLVGFGTNLGVYLAHLTPRDTALLPDMYEQAMSNWWIGVVGAFNARAAHRCPCGRDTAEHRPTWRDLRVAAAALGRSLPDGVARRLSRRN
ncbi:hypothetical protein [Embleya sp. NPDC050493]|uniref:hypothetical protein n=1 Tax=Embleya sp. NPDC050493 TaxID=3363989 RepID=UPI0037A1E0DA